MNKTLLKSVREYKKQSVLAPFFVILEVLMEVLIPMEMAKIIDVGIMQGNLSYIVRRGLILVIMAMLALYFGIIAGKMAATAGAGYAKNLRHDIFYKVQEFSFKNIDRFSTSGLVTRMTTDITNVQMAYMMSIRLLARAPIMIVLSWIMTLLINKKIALLFLIIIPLLGGTLIFIAKKAHPHFIKVFDEYDILNRAIFYVSRMVSSQKERDFVHQHYNDIKKVYSIWVCMNNKTNTLNHIHLKDDKIIGHRTWAGKLDLINIIMIGFADEVPNHDERLQLHRLLSVLLSMEMKAKDKIKIMEAEYGIPIE